MAEILCLGGLISLGSPKTLGGYSGRGLASIGSVGPHTPRPTWVPIKREGGGVGYDRQTKLEQR